MSIERAMLAGTGWMFLVKFAHRGLGLISTLILVRLLQPSDFGLVMMATSVIAMVELLGAFNFDVMLIQLRNAERKHYDTAWTVNVLLSSAMAVILVMCSPWVGAFFQDERVEAIVLVLAASTFVGGFSNIGTIRFRKELLFQREFLFMVGKKLAGVVVTVPLAFVFRDHWALVYGILAGSIGGVILSYAMHPYRPRFSLGAVDEIMSFSKWLLLNNLLQFLRTRSVDLIVGKVSGPAALGHFSLAAEISNLATSELVQPVNRAVFPAYAQLNAADQGLKRAFLRVASVITAVVLPAGVGTALVAHLIVPLFLGPNWIDAIPLIQILAIQATLVALQSNNASLYFALGKPKIATVLSIISVALLLPLIIGLTAYAGAKGAAWGLLVGTVLVVPISFAYVIRELSLRLSEVIGAFWRPAIATAAMAATFEVLSGLFGAPAGIVASIIHLGGLVLTGVAIYLCALWALWWIAGRPDGPEQLALAEWRRRFAGPSSASDAASAKSEPRVVAGAEPQQRTIAPGWLFVLPWDVDAIGGVSRVVDELAVSFRRSGAYAPYLLVLDWKAVTPKIDVSGRIPTLRLRLRPRGAPFTVARVLYYLNLFTVRRAMRAVLNDWRVSVVNVHYPGPDPVGIASLAGDLRVGVRTVVSFHGSDVDHFHALDVEAKVDFARKLASMDAVTFCSRGLRERLVSNCPVALMNAVVMHNGVSRFDRTRCVRSEPRSRRVIVSVGTYHRNKGHDVLLEAFARIAPEFPDLDLRLVGREGPLLETLVGDVERLGLRDRVELLRNVPLEDVHHVYDDACLFVSASRFEPFGLAILEAAQAGLPVVATDTDGARDILRSGRDSLVVPLEDSAALAEAIRMMCRDEDIAKSMASTLRERVLAEFDWDRIAGGWTNLVAQRPEPSRPTVAGAVNSGVL